MERRTLPMSQKERDRLRILSRVKEGWIKIKFSERDGLKALLMKIANAL